MFFFKLRGISRRKILFFARKGAARVNNSDFSAYTENMEAINISDKAEHCRYISYVAGALTAFRSGDARVSFEGDRVSFTMQAESGEAALRRIAEEKIADVLCIGYKYEALEGVRPAGLDVSEREILVSAVIAADFMQDKKYVLTKLAAIRQHCIDGFYEFRMRRLREKWQEIAACIPRAFTRDQLCAFLEYLHSSSKRRIFLKGGEVYDARCRRLRYASLLAEGKDEKTVLREIVLSGAGKVECLGSLSPAQEKFLKQYYAGRVAFAAR